MAHINGTIQADIEKFALSTDPKKAMQEMMATIDALRGIYMEENAALEKSDTRTFMGLQERKIETARQYQSRIAQILERRDEIRAADPTLRQRLVAMQDEFSAIATENVRGLERVQRGVKRLGDRVMGAAREAAQKDVVNYGKKGVLNKYKGPVSIGVSEQA
jgi:hypothetical protein